MVSGGPSDIAIHVVTISASYGAGGSALGPMVAAHLGLPFVDRAIPMDVASRLSVPIDEALSHDERAPSGFWRAMVLLGTGTIPDGSGPIFDRPLDEDAFRLQTEAVIRQVAASEEGGVILGRAAGIVLADRQDTLRVRLDGSAERRTAQAARMGDANAKVNRVNLDRAWDGYVKRFYHRNAADPSLYDLVIDSTTISFEGCVEVIAAAARRPRQ